MRTLTVASDTVTRSPSALWRRSTSDAEGIHVEELRHVAEHAPRQQLEGGFGRLIGIAHRLALLHLLEQARDARIVLRHGDADALELGEDVGAAGLVGDQQLAPVADRLGRHMLVGARVLLHGRDMDAAFMGEGRLRRHKARAGSARGSASRRERARHGSACGASPA